VLPEEIFAREYSQRFLALANSVANQARGFYRLARQNLPAEDRLSMVAAELMGPYIGDYCESSSGKNLMFRTKAYAFE